MAVLDSATPVRAASFAERLLVVVAAAPVLAYLVVAVQRVGYPYELSYFEGSTVEVTARVVAGQALYAPPTTQFTPWPYPPMYFWLTGALARFTGVNLLSLRLVSLAASLVVLVLVAVIVKRASGSITSGVVAAGLYAATYRVSGAWADTARVDSLLLAFLLGAVLIGMRARSWRGGLALGAVLFLAFLTKQNALIVVVPLVAWLLVRRRSVGIVTTGVLALGVVGSTVVGDLVTGGWYSPYVVTQLLRQPVAVRWLWDFWLQDLLYPFAITVLVLVVLLRRWLRDQGRQVGRLGDETAYLAASVGGLVLASWAARLHDGGYSNVAMPAHAGAAIVLGLLLARPLRSRWSTPRVVTVLAAALAVQCAVMTLWHLDVLPAEADRLAGDRFVSALRDLPANVLVPTHPYYLRLAGRPTHASAIAVDDLLRSQGGRAAMGNSLPWSLDGTSAVILDNSSDVTLFGPALTRDFTLVTSTFVSDGVFLPVTDIPTHPSLLYVRTALLPLR